MKKKYLSLILISLVGGIVASYSACSPSHNFKEIEMASNSGLGTLDAPVADSPPAPTPAPTPPVVTPTPTPLPAPAPTPPISKLWANEPTGSTVLVDCPMNNRDCDGKLYNFYSGGFITTLGDGATVYATRLGANQADGDGGNPAYIPGTAMPEMYVGFRWKMNADFQGSYDGINALFYVRAFERPAGGTPTNGNFFLSGPQYGPWKMKFKPNVNQGTRCAEDSGLICPDNETSIPIERDKWYYIEAYVKASSCATCTDGIVRWWVNGKLAGNYNNLSYGTKVVNEFILAPNWEGAANTQCTNRDCTKEWFHYLDHLRISAPTCSGSGCLVTGR